MQKDTQVAYEEGEGINRVEFKGVVTQKRLNFSEKNGLDEESTDIKIFGSTPQVKVSMSRMKELSILKAVVNSTLTKTTYFEEKVTKQIRPATDNYPLSLEGIRNLPIEIGEQLFADFTELNNVSEKKNINSTS
jgi:hypothetical protein